MRDEVKVRVALGERGYDIFCASGLLGDIAADAVRPFVGKRRCLIVSDDRVFPLYGARVKALLSAAGAAKISEALFPAGEASKTLTTVEALCRAAAQAGLERSSLIVALGGGVVGDLAGFTAACYMRGIDYIQVPTTLLAMVDSSVGGKTGADLPEGKNLVGAFWQPKQVLIDPETLRTLPRRELLGGLAEVIKYGVILDAAFLRELSARVDALNALDMDYYRRVIARCCELKATVVSEDEREGGRRAILNYGHTFGHAIEALTGYSAYIHGEAVAVGMLIAADLGEVPGLSETLLALYRRLGLPEKAKDVTPEAVLRVARGDKKSRDGKLRLVIPEREGEVIVTDAVPESRILEAIGGRCD